MPDFRSEPGAQPPPDSPGKQEAPAGGVGPGGSSGMGGHGLPPGGAPGGVPFARGIKTFSIPPWFEVRPPVAREIGTVRAVGTLLTLGNTPVILPGSAFQLPDARAGVIRSFGIQVNNLLLTSQIFWTLKFGGSPVQGWSNLTLFPTPVPFFGENYGPGETVIQVPEGSQIEVEVNVLDAGTYQMGVAYHGWHVPMKMATLQEELYQV